MTEHRQHKLPRPIKVLWGGFNAGVIMGIVDGLMVIFFGLAQFDRTGEIIGFLVWDALGLGILGAGCTALIFYGLGFPLRAYPRLLSVLTLFLIIGVSFSLTWSNLGWSFKRTRGYPPENARNVLLLTLDTLRSDSTGFGGHPFVRTPNLDRLARRGRQYLNAVCPVPMTTPTHASMLTSTIPAVHGATENRYRLDASNETMTEILRNHGYRTAAFVSCFPLDRRFGLNQDFMLYHDDFSVPGDLRQASWFRVLSKRFSSNRMQRNCRWTNSLAIPWIRRYTGDKFPFFLWIHYFDPHAPYNPPKHEQSYYTGRVRPRFSDYPDEYALENAIRAVSKAGRPPEPGVAEELYLGEISEMDRAVGEILRLLSQSGIMDNTLIAALADHGESFGEHGFFYTHGEDIYEPALSIPFVLFSGYGHIPSGLDNRLACASDVASTILPAIGMQPGKMMEGYDLLHDTVKRRTALIENFGIIMTSRATKQRGIRTPEEKLIVHTDINYRELFDLASDPGETQNIADRHPDLTLKLSTVTENRFADYDNRRHDSYEDLSPDTLDRLRSLGYVVPDIQ
jgi:arylsulfatase A-like enzyme